MLVGLLVATPAVARDSLGIYGAWGAFRDAAVPRCYAIAMGEAGQHEQAGGSQAYADVGHWPGRGIRGQVHFHLSHAPSPKAQIVLAIGDVRMRLVGGGGEAWAADARMDAAIVAAMRSASTMSVSSRDGRDRAFSSSFSLAGAPSALDAAALGCAGNR